MNDVAHDITMQKASPGKAALRWALHVAAKAQKAAEFKLSPLHESTTSSHAFMHASKVSTSVNLQIRFLFG